MFQTSAAFWLALLASATGVTAHDVLQIHGSGTTNPSKCFWAIMEDFMDQIRHPLLMTYRAVGSSTGIAEFVNGNAQRPAADFGSGDLPLPEDDYNGLAAAGVGVVQLPILLGAVSFFHNVDGVAELDLDACLFARIFSRDITSWSHGDIVARNPGLATSDLQISVVRRVAGSSSTSSITSVRFCFCVPFGIVCMMFVLTQVTCYIAHSFKLLTHRFIHYALTPTYFHSTCALPVQIIGPPTRLEPRLNGKMIPCPVKEVVASLSASRPRGAPLATLMPDTELAKGCPKWLSSTRLEPCKPPPRRPNVTALPLP